MCFPFFSVVSVKFLWYFLFFCEKTPPPGSQKTQRVLKWKVEKSFSLKERDCLGIFWEILWGPVGFHDVRGVSLCPKSSVFFHWYCQWFSWWFSFLIWVWKFHLKGKVWCLTSFFSPRRLFWEFWAFWPFVSSKFGCEGWEYFRVNRLSFGFAIAFCWPRFRQGCPWDSWPVRFGERFKRLGGRNRILGPRRGR